MFRVLLVFLLLVSGSVFAKMDMIILTPENTVSLRDEVTADSVADIIQKISEIRATSNEVIYLTLESPGGSIFDGADLIRFLDTQDNIIAININSASMSSMIFESMNQRYTVPGSTLMFHRASGGFQGQFGNGELESRLEYVKSMWTEVEDRVSKRLGISLEDYRAKIVNEYWLYGNNILKQKAADKMVQIKCSLELMDIEEERSTVIMGIFQINYKQSACPLLSKKEIIKGEK